MNSRLLLRSFPSLVLFHHDDVGTVRLGKARGISPSLPALHAPGKIYFPGGDFPAPRITRGVCGRNSNQTSESIELRLLLLHFGALGLLACGFLGRTSEFRSRDECFDLSPQCSSGHGNR